MLYLAYGSNLNKKQMSFRCPKAKALESCILSGYKLEFRRVANIKKTNKPEMHTFAQLPKQLHCLKKMILQKNGAEQI